MSEPSHIFVYGTLRVGSDHPMAERLQSWATHVGMGRVPGRLYDMGWYPAALFDENETRNIVGDVFAFGSDGRLLAELDAYEAGDPNYTRSPLLVRLFNGDELAAWAYSVHNPPYTRLIPGGDFISHWTAKKRRPVGP